jgi:CPA1 family monovalent cation:H+ antiporter
VASGRTLAEVRLPGGRLSGGGGAYYRSDGMQSETVFVLLFIVATTVAIAARRMRIPYTVALVLAGLALGSLHAFEPPHLTKDLLFAVFLPGLLFEAAFHIEATDFWRNRLATVSLAVPGVVAAIAVTTVILTPVVGQLHFVGGFTWHYALVFGALIAATDPIAVVGLFKSMGAPKRLRLLVEGESLLNDGTSIVFFTLILGFVGGNSVSVRGLAVDFVSVVGMGALIGIAVGLAVAQVIKRIDDPMVEITLTTIAAYGAFVAAEHLHYSGVIATVAAGMLCGNYAARVGMSPSTRVAVETFWEYVAFALNSLVFLLIGFEVHVRALLESWQAILVAYGVVMVARSVVIATVSALLGTTRERIAPRWSAVLTWGGLRGGLSMVLALGLPASFPHRDLLITMTFGVVVLSILIQGMTMAPLLRWLGIVSGHEARAAYEFHRGSLQAASAALSELESMERHRYTDPDALAEVRADYEERVNDAQAKLHDLHLEREELQSEELHWVRRHLLLVEREQAISGFHEGVLSQDTYERLLSDIDARLLRLESGEEEPPDEEDEADEAASS